MSSRLSKAAAALAAATALAGAAFALGSQSNGSAAAAGTTKQAAPGPYGQWSRKAGHPPKGPWSVRGGSRPRAEMGIAALAKKLGVTPAALRNALQAVAPTPPAPGADGL